MQRQYTVPLVSLISAFACQKAVPTLSQPLVTNSVEISEQDYPSVALLILNQASGQSNCTGTFISSSVVLTAAHCVEGLKDPKNGPLYYARHDAEGKIYAVALAQSATQYPGYDIKIGSGANDLAIVRFPEGTAPAISEIGVSPSIGDPFTIVGYGNNDFTYRPTGELQQASGALTLRSGSNVIYKSENDILYFAGVSRASVRGLQPGTEVSAGQGDSGGPMFVDGKLVGVASGVGYGGNDPSGVQIAVSAYVDLNSWTSQEFLKRVLNSVSAEQP